SLRARIAAFRLDIARLTADAEPVVDERTRAEQLAAEIASLNLRIDKLTNRRQAEERLAVDRAPIETSLVRLRAQLAPLEAELAEIVAVFDAEEAAKRAAADAEAERQRA